ncbi:MULTISPECIES: class I adenylate-forming enzyme family protein [unclassified Solwaraspora]|uniref:class I adenylate-forming enzyme family protein n=1 Tax=unclassified Solwaraspora TaxID=2627926 RepID=UPI00248C7DFD|nr:MULTISPECIES: class I adenylate-forming enzyme family protein [unclassified Solwaraspora]WBB98923.1 class I adenylate-forming enzyme family protein [Solwaraspora sp. WMMA2059]WJK35422.1 class I adenylate-forming enzyme family protein [Solwaraspora sp. WMMA2065]
MTGVQLNMAAGIREFGRATPRRIAVVDGDREVTFGALHQRSSQLASATLDRGLAPGERIAVLSNNRYEYFEISAAMAKAGIPTVPLNPRNNVTDNAYILAHSAVQGIIVADDLADRVDGLLDGLRLVLSFDGGVGEHYGTFLDGGRAVDPQVPVDELDPFCVTYTSGTTGRPKGVLLTHRGRVLTAFGVGLDYGLGPNRSTIAVAPMYHGAGFEFAYAAPMLGGSCTVLPSWDPQRLLDLMVSSRAETVFLVPTHAQHIRRFCPEPAARYDLSALKTLYFNAAALPVALKEWVIEAFPGVEVHELYGSTECSIVTNLRPEFALDRAGSVGHPWFWNEVRLVDEDGAQVGPGEPGELYARSPLLLTGYLNDEEATRAGYDADGFFSVGDIAVRDEEGFISIVDRKKDMIIAGGVNIFPREIEEVIARHGPVDEVAVVGVPDEVYGERIAAFVVSRAGQQIDVSTLDGYVREHVARYKVPREWHVVDQLPRNPSGKILKRTIRDEYVSQPGKG